VQPIKILFLGIGHSLAMDKRLSRKTGHADSILHIYRYGIADIGFDRAETRS
jgi:hypothetical protein